MLDVIVIGGSYAGLSATMQLARARRKVLLVDSGLPRNRFAKTSHGFFGQDGKAPAAILGEASGQIAAYPTAEMVQGEAMEARTDAGGFTVTLVSGPEVHARRLILATGVIDTLPDVTGLRERWGVTVLHCPYCHGYEVRDRPLGVLASHPMSAHQAILIPDWGPTPLFTHGLFEPDAEQSALLGARGVTIERQPVVALLGNGPELDAVRLADGRTIPLKAMFVTPRTSVASPLVQQLGCALDEGISGPVVRVDDWKATTIRGVYAAGDAASLMHNATLASASGVLAGVGAHQSLARDPIPEGPEA